MATLALAACRPNNGGSGLGSGAKPEDEGSGTDSEDPTSGSAGADTTAATTSTPDDSDR